MNADLESPDPNQVKSLVKSGAKKKTKGLKFCNVANKPILSEAIEREVHRAVAQYVGQSQWYDWGLKNFRKQGSLVVMTGPPGTGKTTTARYLTQLVKRPLATLDLGTFGSNEPGGGERNLQQFFADAASNHATVFLDEADGILWDRDKAGGDSMWMVSIINKILMELADYKDLAIIATNRKNQLDPALTSRVIAEIHIDRPDFATRVRLWEAKMPKRYPLQLTRVQCERLADYDLTGRTIESAIVTEAQLAILDQRLPLFGSLCNVAKSLEGK